MDRLEGHVVLLTGAGSGLGRGVARHCLAEGARIAILEISPEKILSLNKEFGHDVLVVQGDVTKIDDLQRCREILLEEHGRLDALVGFQGIFDGNVPLKDISLERLDALFDEMFHVNVKGYILSVRVFLDLLEESHGAIVLTTSSAAYAADGGGANYTATKGAVRSLIGQLAFECAPNIRVNGVAPCGIAKSELRGPAALGLEDQKQSNIPADAFTALFRKVTPLGIVPMAEDYGPIYAFLASRENRVMTGQTVVAEQGLLNRAVINA